MFRLALTVYGTPGDGVRHPARIDRYDSRHQHPPQLLDSQGVTLREASQVCAVVCCCVLLGARVAVCFPVVVERCIELTSL